MVICTHALPERSVIDHAAIHQVARWINYRPRRYIIEEKTLDDYLVDLR
ncbi:MAG: hypothetical protein ACPHSD_18030 [Candidatus Latescibacterota bacterium]